jgi:hypothetical protein
MEQRSLMIGEERHEVGTEVPREGGRIILAHGEVTGHAHAIASADATLYEPKVDDAAAAAVGAHVLGTRVLSTVAPVALTHEEHDPIHVPAGEWGVRIQRQYEAGAFRRVED